MSDEAATHEPAYEARAEMRRYTTDGGERITIWYATRRYPSGLTEYALDGDSTIYPFPSEERAMAAARGDATVGWGEFA